MIMLQSSAYLKGVNQAGYHAHPIPFSRTSEFNPIPKTPTENQVNG